MIHLGDITKISGYDLTPVDVVIGGSPCQDLSIAGKRAGLAGARSGLFMEQIRIIKEMRDADARRGRTGQFVRPRFMVWENVVGAFSSNKGGDFRAVLEETIRVAEPDAPDVPLPAKGKWPLADCWMGDGWSVAYRVLDAQFWGVPQRRRRIALVADFGGHAAPEILFVRKSLCGDIAQGNESRKETAAGTGIVPKNASIICLNDQGGNVMETSSDVSGTLRAQEHGHQPIVIPINTMVATRSNVDDGRTCFGVAESNEPQFSITAAHIHAVYVHQNQLGEVRTGPVAGTLSTNSNASGRNAPLLFENHGQDSRITGPLEVFPTVSAKFGTGGNNTQLVMATGQGRAEITKDKAPTMNCNHEQPIIANTLRGNGCDPQREDMATYPVKDGIVRRLTPLECERLQGYPDGWTDIGPWTDSTGKLHKESSDSARYKALGNSIALPPWSWVLKRLCACYERTATMASLFDGIGGFPLIWERLNGPGSCLWASEIEEFCIAVTKARFPEHNT